MADAEEPGGDVEVYQTDTGFFVSAPDGTTAEVVFTDDGFSIYGGDGLSVDSSTAEAPIPGELASKSKGGYEIESVPAGYEVL